MTRWWKLILTVSSPAFQAVAAEGASINGAVLAMGIRGATVAQAISASMRLIELYDLPVAVDESAVVQLEAEESTEEEIRESIEVVFKDHNGNRCYRAGVIYFE
ncbi:MAG: hypothetical protein CJBNEKGG_04432 [Prosthecobacter sp.]|nr:hypothetical protein [Prosthecobacter sp.]